MYPLAELMTSLKPAYDNALCPQKKGFFHSFSRLIHIYSQAPEVCITFDVPPQWEAYVKENRSFNADRHQRQTQMRLAIGGLLILLVVGGGLVWLFYGGTAAITAVLCLLAGAGVFGLLWLILSLLERWVKDDD